MKEVNEERRKIQLEAVEALEKHDFNGIVILPTGTGKSWVMIECLKRLAKRYGGLDNIWYLCNSTDLRDTGFRKELEDWDALDFDPYITKMCYQSAYKVADQEIPLLLADEFDYSLTPEYSKVYFNNGFKHKIIVSATIDDKKLNLAEEIAPIVYRKELQEVEERKVLNSSNYYFVNFLMSESENDEYLKIQEEFVEQMRNFDAANIDVKFANEGDDKRKAAWKLEKVRKSLEFLKIKRKHFLNNLDSSRDACRKLMKEIYIDDRDCRIVVFCELNRQADAVCKYTYHSDSAEKDYLNAFINKDIQALAVCGKINRGINIPGVNHIILESCNQSKTQLTQRLGRGKRLGVDEILNVYFLVPYYRNRRNQLKPSKVHDWIANAARSLDLSKAQVYKFKRLRDDDTQGNPKKP